MEASERPATRSKLAPLRRRAVSLARRVDCAAGRALFSPRVLVDARTPMNLVVLAPVWRELAADARLDVRFSGPDREDLSQAFDRFGVASRTVTRAAARLQRWDLYLNADPWDPASLLRCRRRVNFFHGVAGKYDLECPVRLPLDLGIYDRIAFPNARRMHRYLAAGLVRPAQAALVGFPKLDALVNRPRPAGAVAARLGLDARVPTVIYAPTFSPHASLQEHGVAIVRTLLDSGLNVIVKLHDRSLDPDPQYSGGHDWRRRFEPFAATGRFLFAHEPDATEYLAASDVMVTDHSTIGFEFCALDRPLVVFDVPALLAAARIDDGLVRLLRSAAEVVSDVGAIHAAVEGALNQPDLRRAERAAVVARVFYDPGRATGRALALCYRLLERPAAQAVRLEPLPG